MNVQVVRGAPDPLELTALTVVLAVLAAGTPEQEALPATRADWRHGEPHPVNAPWRDRL
ncbi:acyl-CoA carboxylase subunit epsilon [Microbispora sp. NPDC049125]|uniref:acyl-CoA carboxylase subunit epsilon n=1 Tax=Microbispora sp. NPDC049125 TaxID=3154929 RepID=UPI003465CFC3